MFRHFKKTAPKSGAENGKGISRRSALTMALAAPICAKAAIAAQPNDAAVADLIQRSEEQARLFNTGQMQRWYDFMRPVDDFTLMQPFGGAASHGFDGNPERLAEMGRHFRNGTAKVELEASYASNDLVVIVYVERQEIEVHGLPMQDWSLRVTQVFRRDGADWRLVHRHADPLVHQLSLEKTAALARGE
jgi:ketosteroid isomerase-like protein